MYSNRLKLSRLLLLIAIVEEDGEEQEEEEAEGKTLRQTRKININPATIDKSLAINQ